MARAQFLDDLGHAFLWLGHDWNATHGAVRVETGCKGLLRVSVYERWLMAGKRPVCRQAAGKGGLACPSLWRDESYDAKHPGFSLFIIS
jgi:hypothetical protein